MWKNRWKILKQMTSYDIKDQRKYDKEDKEFEWDEHNLDNPGNNIGEEGSSSQANVENIHDEEMKSIHD